MTDNIFEKMTAEEAISKLTDMATTLQIPPTSAQGQALMMAFKALKIIDKGLCSECKKWGKESEG